jgi:hypothetical protein
VIQRTNSAAAQRPPPFFPPPLGLGPMLSTDLVSNLANTQILQDENAMQAMYNMNMNRKDVNLDNLTTLQRISSLLQVKAQLQTNMIKVRADICKNIARNIVP